MVLVNIFHAILQTDQTLGQNNVLAYCITQTKVSTITRFNTRPLQQQELDSFLIYQSR
jgi:hypothetical protein